MQDLDVLICGSGVAGLSAAVRAAKTHGMRVGILSKAELHQATTRWAQGGVAAVLGGDDPDSTDVHLADTLDAGAGLCEPDAVRVLVDEGPGRVNELITLGAAFDRDDHGGYALAREGGHSHPRILHAGGAATGMEIERALVEAVGETAAAIYEHHFALDLLLDRGRCVGVRAVGPDGNDNEVRAANVLLATGGAGQLFAVTTNPLVVTGDGVAMALRAGAAVGDLEFVQFHPTALHHPAMPRPLLSETLRGHGALLRDSRGERFVDELSPRDVVSRAMSARMLRQGVDHLWLDATGLDRFHERFPTLAANLQDAGLDPACDWLPIAPAAHYFCGGVLADLDGATSVPGLWVAGETACNGVHGANRLASNSLLDGMVFGPRIVEAIDCGRLGPEPTGVMRAFLDGGADGTDEIGIRQFELPTDWDAGPVHIDVAKAREELQRAMSAHAGAVRSGESLDLADAAARKARAEALACGAQGPSGPTERGTQGPSEHGEAAQSGELRGGQGATRSVNEYLAAHELRNLAEIGRAVIAGARTRCESRGAHTRTDYPERDDSLRTRLVARPDRQGAQEGH